MSKVAAAIEHVTKTLQAEMPEATKADVIKAKPKRNTEAPPMKAVAFYGKHDMRVIERHRPMVTDPEDAILRVTSTCVCGSDLHVYEGYVVGVLPGDIMGHEFMGIVEEVGPAVTKVKPGDRVVEACSMGCGSCRWCSDRGGCSACDTTNVTGSGPQEVLYGDHTAGMFGYGAPMGGYDGGQAEYVRVPFANNNLMKIDPRIPEEKVLFLSDILPTAWHATEMGEVGPGSNVAIWGAGPVGMLAAQCSFNRGAARVVLIDPVEYRLEHAAKHIKGLETMDNSKEKVEERLKALFPDMHGPDVCIEAVGFHYTGSLLHRLEQKASNELQCGRLSEV